MSDRITHVLRCVSVGVAAGVLLASAVACGGAAQTADTLESVPIPSVEVVQARQGAVPLFERLTGTVRAAGEVAIYPEAPGSVAAVLVDNGQRVNRGDVLVRIRTAGSAAQVDQARSALDVARAAEREAAANLEQLESQYERHATLAERGLVAADLVSTLRTSVEAAEAVLARTRAEVAQAQAAVTERTEVQSQSTVRAPISGRVGQRNVEVGMRVDTQVPLFVIGRLDDVRVEVPVTQDVLAHVERGQRVDVHVQGRQQPIEATVSRISPFLASGSYTAEVEVDVPNPDGALLAGMFVTVDVYYGDSDVATLLPTSTMYTDPTTGQRGIFVAPDGPLPQDDPDAAGVPMGTPGPMIFRPVEVVAEAPDVVGVDNVNEGEWVVAVGQHLLSAQTADADGTADAHARARAITWERLMELQGLQREDLLRDFMERQQRAARDALSSRGG